MKKVLLLSLLMLSQVSLGQDSLRIEYDKLTIEIDSLRVVKRNYEDKFSRYFELKELLKDVNNKLENHKTLPRGSSVQDLKTYKNKYLAELKTLKAPTDKQEQEYADAVAFIRIKESDRQQIEQMSQEVSIYPNPTTDKVTIQTESYATKEVEIFDMLGKKVMGLTFSGKEGEISLHNLKVGIYIIKIKEENNSTSRKLIIK